MTNLVFEENRDTFYKRLQIKDEKKGFTFHDMRKRNDSASILSIPF